MGAMTFSKIEKIIFDLAEPIAEENGLYIYDVEFIKEGGHWFLRVYLDKPEENEYISIDECEEFSRKLSDVLDRSDPISQNYYLEVSSPGIERKIRRAEHFSIIIIMILHFFLGLTMNKAKYLYIYLLT